MSDHAPCHPLQPNHVLAWSGGLRSGMVAVSGTLIIRSSLFDLVTLLFQVSSKGLRSEIRFGIWEHMVPPPGKIFSKHLKNPNKNLARISRYSMSTCQVS
jgi:hypothetical protein